MPEAKVNPVTHNPQEDAFYEKVDPRKTMTPEQTKATKFIALLVLTHSLLLGWALYERHQHLQYKAWLSWYSGIVDYLNSDHTKKPLNERIPIVLSEITKYRAQISEHLYPKPKEPAK